MTKYKEPLHIRENKKDEEIRKASNPAYAHGMLGQRYGTYERKREHDLTGSLVDPPPQPTPKPRKGKHVPMGNEGPYVKWPGIYPDAKK